MSLLLFLRITIICLLTLSFRGARSAPPSHFWITPYNNSTLDTYSDSFAIASNGDVYLIGRRVRPPGPDCSLFIALVKSDGQLAWATTFAPAAGEVNALKAITIDAQDNIYVAGSYNRAFMLGGASLPAPTNIDVFVCRFRAGRLASGVGMADWCLQGHGDGNDDLNALIVDKGGNVIVLGSHNSADVQWGNTTHLTRGTPVGSRTWMNPIFTRISPQKVVLTNLQGSSVARVQNIAITLLSMGDYVITGMVAGTVSMYDYNGDMAQGTEMFVARYAANDTLSWVVISSSVPTSTPFTVQPFSIASDLSDRIVVVGRFENARPVSLPIAPGGALRPRFGRFGINEKNGLVVGFDSRGQYTWSAQLNGTNSNKEQRLQTVDIDYCGGVYVGGFYYSDNPPPFPGLRDDTNRRVAGLKFNSAGSFQWAFTDNDVGSGVSGRNVAMRRMVLDRRTGTTTWVGEYNEGTLSFPSAQTQPETTSMSLYILRLRQDPACSSVCTSIDACNTCNGDNSTCTFCVWVDACGKCNGNNSTCRLDCKGIANGNTTLDACGICGGRNDTCTFDCKQVAYGNATVDACGVCGGKNDSCVFDCKRVANGNATVDACGVCGGRNNTCPFDCKRVANGNTTLDACGVCGGRNDSCPFDCRRVAYGNATVDACGVCGGRNNTCPFDCKRVANGNATLDACGVCGGRNNTCPFDCKRVANGNATVDACGVCGGNNSSCTLDCRRVVNGNATVDACGVCAGDNSTCWLDCRGVANGNATLDACGVCGGANTTCPFDCHRVAYGSAVLDACGKCGGTNSSCVNAGLVFVDIGARMTDETGTPLVLSVRFTSPPDGPLQLTLECDHPHEARLIGPTLMTFDLSNWNVSKNVTVQGIRSKSWSSQSSDVAFTVSMYTSTGSGSNAKRNSGTLVTSISLHNHHYVWPVINSFNQPLSPLIGDRNVTIVGQGFNPNATLLVGDKVPNQYMVVQDSNTIIFAGSQNITGYYPVEVYNDRVEVSHRVEGKMYFTKDCPYENQWGYGLDCAACPEGAQCPGGYRMWPQPGYWNPNETAGFVQKCNDPPERCLGGQRSQCGPGYSGSLCGSCGEGYFLQTGACLHCGPESTVVALAVVDVAFLLLLVIAMFVLRNKYLSRLFFLLTLIQVTRAAGQVMGSNLPEFLQPLYSILSLSTFDIEFVRPGCTASGSSPFIAVFWGTVASIAAFAVPVIIGLPLVGYFHQDRDFSRRKSQEDIANNKSSKDHSMSVRRWYRNRWIRALLVYSSFVYFNLTTKCLSALNCVNIQDALHLTADTNVICFQGDHQGVAAVAIIILVLFTAGYPLLCLRIVVNNRHRLKDLNMINRFGFIFSDYRPHSFWFFVLWLGFILCQALSFGVLTRFPWGQFVIGIGSFVFILVFVIVRRPFVSFWKNLTCGFAMVIGLSGSLLAFISNLIDPQVFNVLSTIIIVLIILMVAGVFVYFIYRSRGKVVGAIRRLSAHISTPTSSRPTTMRKEKDDEEGPGTAKDTEPQSIELREIETPSG